MIGQAMIEQLFLLNMYIVNTRDTISIAEEIPTIIPSNPKKNR